MLINSNGNEKPPLLTHIFVEEAVRVGRAALSLCQSVCVVRARRASFPAAAQL